MAWEVRSTSEGRRLLGLCAADECGSFFTLGETSEATDGLADFLLNGAPLQPATPPQLRLFLRHAGLGWRHHHTSCECGSSFNFFLLLDRRIARDQDPVTVELCIECGRLTAGHWFMGEHVEVQALPESWSDNSLVLSRVRQALAARAATAKPTVEEDWDFGA